jgi:hypothetical protein
MCSSSRACIIVGLGLLRRRRLGNDHVDRRPAAIVEGEDCAARGLCAGDYDPDKTDEADRVV